MTQQSYVKFKAKLTRGLKKELRNMVCFHASRKSVL